MSKEDKILLQSEKFIDTVLETDFQYLPTLKRFEIRDALCELLEDFSNDLEDDFLDTEMVEVERNNWEAKKFPKKIKIQSYA